MDGVNLVDGVDLAITSQGRWFEDFMLGERFELPSRTMTATLFRLYIEASGEGHPLHADDVYARTIGLPGAVAHGFLVLIQTTAGASRFHELVQDSLIGLSEQSSRFARPVFIGDVLRPILQVVELSPNDSTGQVHLRSTVHNQRGELVLEGTQRYLLRRRV
jgi:acyl dehydratase